MFFLYGQRKQQTHQSPPDLPVTAQGCAIDIYRQRLECWTNSTFALRNMNLSVHMRSARHRTHMSGVCPFKAASGSAAAAAKAAAAAVAAASHARPGAWVTRSSRFCFFFWQCWAGYGQGKVPNIQGGAAPAAWRRYS